MKAPTRALSPVLYENMFWNGGLNMPKITGAFMEASERLSVNLDNGHVIFIPLASDTNATRFARVLTRKCEYNPHTDATGVYWRDGPRLSLDEIIEMINGGHT